MRKWQEVQDVPWAVGLKDLAAGTASDLNLYRRQFGDVAGKGGAVVRKWLRLCCWALNRRHSMSRSLG